jgi:hypothetical protein
VEGNEATTISLHVALSAASDSPVTVSYATADGTATADVDYVARNGTIEIPAGATSADLEVGIIGDADMEEDETFSIRLSNPVNATLANPTLLLTISDDDIAAPADATARSMFNRVWLQWSSLAPFAESYNVYSADEPGITPANWTTLQGGATQAVTETSLSLVVDSLVSLDRYYIVTATRRGIESAASPELAVPRSGRGAYSVQMHIHGHSNHNARSAKPGSMQWHSSYASETGTRVIWWSDHEGMFDQSEDGYVDITRGTLDPTTMNVENLPLTGTDPTVEVTQLEASVSGGVPTVSLDPAGLHLALVSDADAPDWQWLNYQLEASTTSKRIAGFIWPRPVASGAQLSTDLDCPPGDDVRCEVEITLAWHRYDGQKAQQKLIFRLAQHDNTYLESPDTVVVETTQTTFDIASAISLLRDGSDNTIEIVRFRLGARAGATASAHIASLRMHSTRPEAPNQIDTITGLAQRYGVEYGLSEHVGVEGAITGPHLNTFLPVDLDADALGYYELGDPVVMVGAVHARGGLVSYNHMFGTESGGCGPPDAGSEQRVLDTASELLANRIFGADILEVGYVCRGGIGITDHLRAWDLLTANGLSLTGTGVTDTHGDPWQWNMAPNAFTTWVIATGMDKPALIEGLRQNAAYFGNPFLWDGVFTFTLGRAEMGQALAADSASTPLVVTLEPWPDDVKVLLFQGAINETPDMHVDYLREAMPLLPGQITDIDTSRRSFVRLEAWKDENGELTPLAFTNVIQVLPLPCQESRTRNPE